MCIQKIENQIIHTLNKEAKQNALEFVTYLKNQNMRFELCTSEYWHDKQYWYVKYKNEFIGFIFINGYTPLKDETEPEGWIFWSSNYNSDFFTTFHIEEEFKQVAYKHVDFGTCGGGLTVNLFGKEFNSVCTGTTFRFDNPDCEDLVVLKKLIDIRRLDLTQDN